MMRTNTLIIGAGQAGLAMSRVLSDLEIENVILERGRIGERWRSERWDSLTLLTPRWQSRLPGYQYGGPDPHGFMARNEVIEYLDGFARTFDAPVLGQTAVTQMKRHPWGFRVTTARGEWLARNVVIATGQAMSPRVPHFSRDLEDGILQIVPTEYHNPNPLPSGGVLVVGAAATGIQLASEIHASGRPVTLAVGDHTRMPRSYRGRDIMWWMDRIGVLGEPPHHAEPHLEPSLHLIGSPDHRSIDLDSVQQEGIRLTGRAVSASGDTIRFSGDLGDAIATSEARLGRLLDKIDRYIETEMPTEDVPAPVRPVPVPVPATPGTLSLREQGIRTVLWATGYARSYPWLHLPVFDERGEIHHRGGITAEPGLYVMGLHFLRRRNSTFIDGVGRDALELGLHIAQREKTRIPDWYAAPEVHFAITRAS